MFTTPDASPASSSGTAATATADVGPVTMPCPAPMSRKPGMRSVTPLSSPICETRRKPSPIERKPMAIGPRPPTR